MIKNIKTFIEQAIFASRWLQAPIYLILTLVLFVFVYDIGKEVFFMFFNIDNYTGYKLVLLSLTLCDTVLVANLVIVVIISGYENFVFRNDENLYKNIPMWLRKLSPTGVKMKIAGSIVAISSISLLKQFLEISNISNRVLLWNIVIHVVFVLSAFMIAITGILEKKIH